MELKRILGNTFFIVIGFLSGCGFDDAPVEPAPKIEVVRVETFKPEVPVVKAEEEDASFEGLDDFASLGIPEGWGE